MTADTETISLENATVLLTKALMANGVPESTATSVATALVAAQAEGQAGHGFSRLSDYVAQVRSGKIVADAVPVATASGAAALSVDAGHGFAFPALDLGIANGVACARDTGCAAVTIARSHHCGALSVTVDRIAQAGMIGLMVANTPAAIAPFGSNVPLYGTNPIAFAAPRADAPPLVIDLSLSVVARGKVMNAHKTGQAIPEGWALDADGSPTTDPKAALAGSMVPIGGAKGTALALMVEVLAATLTGAQGSAGMPSYFDADGPPPGSGQFLFILRPGDSAGFALRLEALLGQIAAAPGARLPGSRRLASLQMARTEGLEVPRIYLDNARALAGLHD